MVAAAAMRGHGAEAGGVARGSMQGMCRVAGRRDIRNGTEAAPKDTTRYCAGGGSGRWGVVEVTCI